MRSATAIVGVPVAASASTSARLAGLRAPHRSSRRRRGQRLVRALTRGRDRPRPVGAIGTTSSSTSACRARSARRQPGRDGRRGVGRGQVGRRRHDGEDRGIGAAAAAGSSPRVVADERDRARRELACERAVLRAADDREVRRRADRSRATAGARATRVQRRGELGRRRGSPRPRRPTSVASIRPRASAVGGAQEQVDAGPRRRDRRRPPGAGPWASAPMSSASLIVTPSNPSSLAQQAGHDGARQRRRHASSRRPAPARRRGPT